MSATLETTPEQIAALAARPAGEPVLMVNLLKFKTQVAWSPTFGTGRRSHRTCNA